MKISATEEYGLRCILRVAQRFEADEPITAQEVAEAEGISAPYAQKLLRQFGQAELIESRRGVGGGYVLARHPERISVLDVVRALNADFDTSDVCDKHTGDLTTCTHAGSCTIRPVWSFIEEFVSSTLDRLTLHTLMAGNTAVLRELSAPTAAAVAQYCPVEQLKARHEQ